MKAAQNNILITDKGSAPMLPQARMAASRVLIVFRFAHSGDKSAGQWKTQKT